MKLALLTFVSFAIIPLPAAEEKRVESTRALFGSEENFAIVEKADTVAACVLRYTPPPGKVFGPGERYDETEFVAVEAVSAARIRAALLSDASYQWGIVTGCWPRYGVRLRFRKADKTVTVDVCLSRKHLLVARERKPIGGGLFHHAAQTFEEELKKLFPQEKLR